MCWNLCWYEDYCTVKVQHNESLLYIAVLTSHRSSEVSAEDRQRMSPRPRHRPPDPGPEVSSGLRFHSCWWWSLRWWRKLCSSGRSVTHCDLVVLQPVVEAPQKHYVRYMFYILLIACILKGMVRNFAGSYIANKYSTTFPKQHPCKSATQARTPECSRSVVWMIINATDKQIRDASLFEMISLHMIRHRHQSVFQRLWPHLQMRSALEEQRSAASGMGWNVASCRSNSDCLWFSNSSNWRPAPSSQVKEHFGIWTLLKTLHHSLTLLMTPGAGTAGYTVFISRTGPHKNVQLWVTSTCNAEEKYKQMIK